MVCTHSSNRYIVKPIIYQSSEPPLWSRWPLGLPHHLSVGDDLISHRSTVEARSERLFVRDEAKVMLKVLHGRCHLGIGLPGMALERDCDVHFSYAPMTNTRKY